MLGCSSFVSAAVIKHSSKKQFRGEMGLFRSVFPGYGPRGREATEHALGRNAFTPRMREESVHTCLLACTHFDLCTIQDLGNTYLGNDAAHRGLDLPTSLNISNQDSRPPTCPHVNPICLPGWFCTGSSWQRTITLMRWNYIEIFWTINVQCHKKY